MMRLSDFSFLLPPALVARYPLPERSASRLLCLEQHRLRQGYFRELEDLLQPGDLLIFNDSKVIPARLLGRKATGGRVEVLIERLLDAHTGLAQVKASKKLRLGENLFFSHDICLQITAKQGWLYVLRYLGRQSSHPPDRQAMISCQDVAPADTLSAVLEEIGLVPIPPYLGRASVHEDRERYQTIYARYPGSVAAPTAGLHFDAVLLQTLAAKGIKFGYVTLHIGAGTFVPVRVENIVEHTLHAEWLQVSTDLAEQIRQTKAAGKRVIAVGTTTLRALLTATSSTGEIHPYCGETQLFVYPGYAFPAVPDALITNLHLPCSSLLMLVAAFGGYDRVMRAYQCAIDQAWRFYSYGDAMWISVPEDRG